MIATFQNAIAHRQSEISIANLINVGLGEDARVSPGNCGLGHKDTAPNSRLERNRMEGAEPSTRFCPFRLLELVVE